MRKIDRVTLFVVCCFGAVFPLQALTGFEIYGMLAWTPPQTAAIILNTRLENWLVGYESILVMEDGWQAYFYALRYPFLFTIISKILLWPFENDLMLWIYFSKQWMNLIFLGLVFYSYLFLKEINLISRYERFSILFLSFSGFTFLKYKTMIHFDFPTILCLAAFSYSLLRFKKYGENKSLIFWAILGGLFGRGPMFIFYLIAWLIIEVGHFAYRRNNKRDLRYSFFLLFASSFFSTLFTLYNVVVESRLNQISLLQSGVIDSAKRRLGLIDDPHKTQEFFELKNFLLIQLDHLFHTLTSYLRVSDTMTFSGLLTFLLLGIFLATGFRFFKKLKAYERQVFGVGIFGYILFVIVMKRLVVYHEYVAIYSLLFVLLFYASIASFVRFKKIFFVFSAIIFLGSLSMRFLDEFEDHDLKVQIVQDFQSIRNYMLEEGLDRKAIIYVPEGHRELLPAEHGTNSIAFYFPGHPISLHRKHADFILTGRDIEQLDAVVEGEIVKLYRYR